MAIELVTFGGLHVLDDDGELDWLLGQRTRAAILIYLAVERRVSREALITVFWPESDTESARHALRQSLYQLKKAVRFDWVESHAHELVVTDDIRADVTQFADAIEQGELNTAVELYRGPFLDGVHLVDLSSWETWVDARRAQYARTFRKACRDLLEAKLKSADMRGAIDVAERWVLRDPKDDEAQHRLIETLALAGERTDAVRQYETYVRMLQADGLDPSKQTRELGERLRSEPSALPALETGSAHLPRSTRSKAIPSRRTIVLAAVAVLIGLGLMWGASTRTRPGTLSGALAVLPFSVHGGPSVQYLREGMVNLLTVALDGAGSLRPVDVRATLAATDAEDATSPDAQLNPDRVASKVGAELYLLGDVVEAGDRIQVQAAIYRRGIREPSARAVVSGHKDSVFALADQVAARLLAEVSDPSANRLLRTASTTTSSLPAFKEYLEGDRHMRAGRFERAADSYLAAISHDSTFAVAYYRLGLAREWAPLPGEDRAAATAARFASRLSPRDRNLLEAFRAWRSGKAAEAENAYRAILARYPDDVDAWFQLGEIQFHHGPLLGHSIGDADEAWRKVLSFEPRNPFAITHLARLAITEERLQTVDSLLGGFSSSEVKSDRRLAELVLLRAVARGDTATSRALTRSMREWEALAAWRVGVFLAAFSGHPDRMRPVVYSLISDGRSPQLRADVLWFVSLLDIAAGRIRIAENTLAEASRAEGSVAADHRRRGFEAVSEWYAATLPLPYSDSTLTRWREAASSFRSVGNGDSAWFNRETELGATVQLDPLRQYTLGVLSLRLRDTASAAVAAGKLQQLAASPSATVMTRDLDRGLRARLAWSRRNAPEAERLLTSLEQTETQGDIAATPFAARAAERFFHGELLIATGRDTEALKWFASLGDGSVSEVPLRALAHLRQAEIHERLNHRPEAATHYTRFLALWSRPDDQFRPTVTSARQRLVALTRITAR